VYVGNEVQMTVVSNCGNSTVLVNDFCNPRNNACDAHCKTHYRSINAKGYCDLSKHLCTCTYCGT